MTKWLTGILPGAVAAVVASLVSLPLDSPDDAVLNTGTVTIGALLIGFATGIVWQALSVTSMARPAYVGALAAGFAAVVIAAAIGEATLSGTMQFVLPLAALSFGIAGVLTPLVSLLDPGRLVSLAAPTASLAIALGIGIGLSGQGDGESGDLDLPELQSTPVAGEVVDAGDVEGITYVVVPGESKLTYTVREKLSLLPNSSDAVGSTSSLSGEVFLDGQPSTVAADMSTLSSDQDRRDQYVQQNIFNTDSTVTFVVEDLGQLPDEYTPGTTITQTLGGTATVRGVERPITFQIEARLDGDTLQVLGETDFTWADFEITPPNTSVVEVEDNVHIEVLVIARPADAA